MNSMTGFGAATAPLNNASVRVEIGGVNRKQTEISISLPRAWAELETRVRDLVAGCVSRGRVNVTISLQAAAAGSGGDAAHGGVAAAVEYLAFLPHTQAHDLQGMFSLLSFDTEGCSGLQTGPGGVAPVHGWNVW